MNKKIIGVFILGTLFLTGCSGATVQYNGEVTAIVNQEEASFEKPVSDIDISDFVYASNKIGLELFNTNIKDSKLVAPYNITDTLLDICDLADENFSNNLKTKIPNLDKIKDTNIYLKQLSIDTNSKKSLWIAQDEIIKYKKLMLKDLNIKDFDLYLINNNSDKKNLIINEYVSKTINNQIFNNIIDMKDENKYNLININNLNLDLSLNNKNSEITSENNRKYFISYDNVIKSEKFNDFNLYQIPIANKNPNLVLDVFSADNISDKFVKLNYEDVNNMLIRLDDSNYKKVKKLKILDFSTIYNNNNTEDFKNSGFSFLFEKNILNIEDTKVEDVNISSCNFINNIKVSFDTSTDERKIDNEKIISDMDSISLDNEFIYIIRDIENKTIYYIGYNK